MASIIQASDRHQQARADAGNYVKSKTYDPATKAAHKGLNTTRDFLIGKPVSSMLNRQYQPVRGTGSFVKSAVNVAKNYDAAVSKNGEIASRYAGAANYYGVKTALSIIPGVEGTKIGRAIQEGLAIGLGFTVRAIGLIATTIIRALPYIAIAAGIAFGGWKIGVLGIAAMGAVKFTLVTAAVAYVVINQAQIAGLFRKIGNLVKSHNQDNAAKNRQIADLQAQLAEGGILTKAGRLLAKHKGKVAAGAFALAAYHYGPDALKAAGDIEIGGKTVARRLLGLSRRAGTFSAPYVRSATTTANNIVEGAKETFSPVADAASSAATSVSETADPVLNEGAYRASQVMQGVAALFGATKAATGFNPECMNSRAFAGALPHHDGITSRAYAAVCA